MKLKISALGKPDRALAWHVHFISSFIVSSVADLGSDFKLILSECVSYFSVEFAFVFFCCCCDV